MPSFSLMRDRDVPNRFISTGPWASLEEVEQWRASAAFTEGLASIRDIIEHFEPHTLDNYVSQVVIGDVIPDASMPDSGTRGVHMDAGGCGFSFTDIEVGKVTDDKYQSYQCNTVTNANWADGFDASRMQYDKIGVTAAFPYPRPPATVSPTK